MKKLLPSILLLGLLVASCGGKKEKQAETTTEETKTEMVEAVETPDSLAAEADSMAMEADTLAAEADTLVAE